MNFLPVLKQQFLLPVLRYNDAKTCASICEAFLQNNFPVVEITLTTPGALELIKDFSEPGLWVGAGSVTSLADAKAAHHAGATFLVSAGLVEDVSRYAKEAKLPYFPGVVTPTEVLKAMSLGHKELKLFPAASFGGVGLLKSLKGPFPQVDFIPTGGITLADLDSYKKAGAIAAGLGGNLIPSEIMNSRNKINQFLQTLKG